MTVLLPAIVPVALIALLGFIAGRTLTVERKTLSQLTIYLFFPALVAESLRRTTLSLESATGLVIGYGLASLVLYGLVLGINRFCNFPPPVQKSLIATTLFANTGNLGLPFTTFALGEAGQERAVVYLIASAILVTGIGPALLKGGNVGSSLALLGKLPLIWAMVGGICLRLFVDTLPLGVDDAITMAANAAIPVALVTLGIQLSQTPFKIGTYELLAGGMRLVMGPGIAYAIAKLIQLDPLDLQVLVIQGAMPTAVTSIIWVSEFGGDRNRVARTIVVSTMISLVTLPCVLWITTQ